MALSGGCGAAEDFGGDLDEALEPHRFNLVGWEVETLFNELSHWLASGSRPSAGEAGIVVDYFNRVAQENTLLGMLERDGNILTLEQQAALTAQLDEVTLLRQVMERKAQLVLEAQIKQTTAKFGIFNPLDSFWNRNVVFPPVKLTLQPPPKLLVISSRAVIERLTTVTLKNSLTMEQVQLLEEDVDGLGVSSLVVELGGIATYPSFVNNKYGLQFAIYTAVEEWLHQYLFFRPLGARYGLNELGFNQPYEIIIMNETLAGMASQEIGDRLIADYYAAYFPPPDDGGGQNGGGENPFVVAMRSIRQEVDRLLGLEEIESAEQFMRESRDQLEAKGYYIRKLNQAYFAFYGSYADSPAFPSPIYEELLVLRSESEELSDFLQTASAFTSREELAERAGR
jgi:hypothetical protein